MGFKIFIVSSNKNGYTDFIDLLSSKNAYMNKTIQHYSIKCHSDWDMTTIYIGNLVQNLKLMNYDGGIILLDKDDEIPSNPVRDVPIIQIYNFETGNEAEILQSLLLKISVRN